MQRVLRSQESCSLIIFCENLKTQVMRIFAHDLQLRYGHAYIRYTQTDNKNLFYRVTNSTKVDINNSLGYNDIQLDDFVKINLRV